MDLPELLRAIEVLPDGVDLRYRSRGAAPANWGGKKWCASTGFGANKMLAYGVTMEQALRELWALVLAKTLRPDMPKGRNP